MNVSIVTIDTTTYCALPYDVTVFDYNLIILELVCLVRKVLAFWTYDIFFSLHNNTIGQTHLTKLALFPHTISFTLAIVIVFCSLVSADALND